MSLKDCIKRDNTRVFMNTKEFADDLRIQIGDKHTTTKGSLQQESISNNAGNSSPLQQIAYTLYLPYPITMEKESIKALFSSGTRITINNEPYSVVDVSNEIGLATIHLKAGSGR